MKQEKKGKKSKIDFLGRVFPYLLIVLGLTGFYFFAWAPIIEALHTFR